jgi:hypothetical protein
MADASTNAPTPISIRLVPYSSVFAKRRGKTGKSTARIAMMVTSIMDARKLVRKDLRGSERNKSTAAKARSPGP